ncbi:MAG: small ribosomal subunit Rsm22 family protein [Rhabdochlamydiaceae bacterium]
MSYYEAVLDLINETVKDEKFKSLSEAGKQLMARYKNCQNKNTVFIQSDTQRKSYLVTRFPATYAVNKKVLDILKTKAEKVDIETIMDIGAGPGTATWNALDFFPEIKRAYAFEKDGEWIRFGKQIQSRLSIDQKTVSWIQRDVAKSPGLLPDSDLTILSYSIGEMAEHTWTSLLKTLWNKTKQFMVVIEAGTPTGFKRILKIRDFLINEGGDLLSPCPHKCVCPLDKKDWCHFSVRLSRTSLHRKMKEASLGYEDEKFCYLVFSKNLKRTVYPPIIIRKPLKQEGRVLLKVCSQDGVKDICVSKKNKEYYKSSRKLEWGDSISQQTEGTEHV